MSSRREVLETLATLAASSRAAQSYDLDDLRDADPDSRVGATFEQIGVGSAGFDVLGAFGGAALDREDATDERVAVSYSDRHVFLSAEAVAVDDPDVVASAGVCLSNEQARDLAVALYRAAEERAAETKTEDADR